MMENIPTGRHPSPALSPRARSFAHHLQAQTDLLLSLTRCRFQEEIMTLDGSAWTRSLKSHWENTAELWGFTWQAPWYVFFRIKWSQYLHQLDVFSLLSQIGRSWMLSFFPHMQNHRGDHLQPQRLLSMSRLLTGFQASVLCSGTWLSISSIRIGLGAMKGLEIQERCGEHDYSFLSDSHWWQEALLAVWYVCFAIFFWKILSLNLPNFIFSSRLSWFWNTSCTTIRLNSPITVTPMFRRVSLSCFLLLFCGLPIIPAASMNTIWRSECPVFFFFFSSGPLCFCTRL